MRSTSRSFRMDSLLAGTLILPWRVHCAGMMSSAALPCRKHSGHRESHSGLRRKPFAFPPESFSRSPRNPIRLAPESARGFGFLLLGRGASVRECEVRVHHRGPQDGASGGGVESGTVAAVATDRRRRTVRVLVSAGYLGESVPVPGAAL